MKTSNENLGVSNKNLGVSNTTIGISNESLGVSNENMEVSNEHMGSPMKIYKIFPRFQIVDKMNPRKGLCPVRAVTLSTLS